MDNYDSSAGFTWQFFQLVNLPRPFRFGPTCMPNTYCYIACFQTFVIAYAITVSKRWCL